MRKILILLSFLLISSYSRGQSVQFKEVKTDQYPLTEVKVFDRNPEPWKTGEIELMEDNTKVDSISIQKSSPEKRPYKKVFILFENSHFGSFEPQRTYQKAFLQDALSHFSDKDELYFSEFDWTLANGKVLNPESIYKGDKEVIGQIVEEIKKPVSNSKTHESTELNTALMEAMEYMNGIPVDSLYEKVVIIFSSEFSNIYNSIHTPESIILSARQKNIPIYSVRYPRMGPKYSLSKITAETFGEHFGIDLSKDQKELVTQFGKIIEGMTARSAGNFYQLDYTTSKLPGSKPVGLKIRKLDDPLTYESIYTTPSYMDYLLISKVRIVIASLCLVFIFLLIFFFVNRNRKIRRLEKEESDKKFFEMKEESILRIGEQEKALEKLENERKSLKEKELVIQLEQANQLALSGSLSRFNQIARVPFLIGQDGTKYALSMENLIGRSQIDGCSILINDSTVSRKHALILFERSSLDTDPEANNSFYIIDLNSSNGSFVNERPVSRPVVLKNSDLIRTGEVSLTFRI